MPIPKYPKRPKKKRFTRSRRVITEWIIKRNNRERRSS